MTIPSRIEATKRRISSQLATVSAVLMPRDQRLERRIGRRRSEAVEAPLAEVADARREPEAQQRAGGKDLIGCRGRVGRVLVDAEPAAMIEQSVEDVRRLARRRGDGLGMKGPELVGEMGVEHHAGLVPVASIDEVHRLAVTAGAEVLPVRG